LKKEHFLVEWLAQGSVVKKVWKMEMMMVDQMVWKMV
jgi:hypothetical protein